MPTQKFTQEILAAALIGFEEQKRNINAKIAELRAMLSGGGTEAAAAAERIPRKRKVSAAARRRMALAQKARQAKSRGASKPPVPVATPKRRISKEGMERIIAATKKRWRLKRAAEKAALVKKVAAKKVAVKKAVVKAPTAKAAEKVAPVRKTAVKKAVVAKAAPAPTPALVQTAG